jgi:hypothetical protein
MEVIVSEIPTPMFCEKVEYVKILPLDRVDIGILKIFNSKNVMPELKPP